MARPKIDDPEAKAKILAAAEELFAARGYTGTAIRDIASKAGVNGAMIHYYFANKEGLYHTLLETAANGVRALLEEAAGSAESTKHRLERLVEAYAQYIFSHPNFARILHRELLAGGKHIAEIVQHYPQNNYTILRDVIATGVRRKELRAIDVELAPISLFGMIVIFQIFQPLISLVLGSKRYDERFIKRLSSHTVDLFLYGAQRSDREPSRNSAKRQSAGRKTRVKK